MSALYPKSLEKFLQGSINMASDTIKASLIDTGVYTYAAAHDFYDDLTGVEEDSAALTGKTFVDGKFDADDVTWSGTSGANCEAIIIWKDTGTPATSPVLAYIDAGAGLPVTLGGDVQAVWGAHIFALSS